MNNINKQTKREYFFNNIIYAVLVFIWYKASLLRSVPGLTRADSVLLLWGMIIISLTIGIITRWRKRRNNLSVFTNIFLPFGLYTLITYRKTLPVLCTIAVVLSVLLCLVYSYIIMSRTIRSRRHKGQILIKRAGYCLMGAKSIIALGLSAIVIFLGANALLGNSLIKPNTPAVYPSSYEESYENADTTFIYKFEDPLWQELSTKEKANSLQKLANMQAQRLGLNHELNISLKALEDNLCGAYSDSDHTIYLNIAIIDDAFETLDTVFHESYHAYQHRLCDAYDSVDEASRNLDIFRNVKYYKAEFENYTDGDEDFSAYYCQKCESTAREYAEDNVEAVKMVIENHMSITNPTNA